MIKLSYIEGSLCSNNLLPLACLWVTGSATGSQSYNINSSQGTLSMNSAQFLKVMMKIYISLRCTNVYSVHCTCTINIYVCNSVLVRVFIRVDASIYHVDARASMCNTKIPVYCTVLGTLYTRILINKLCNTLYTSIATIEEQYVHCTYSCIL